MLKSYEAILENGQMKWISDQPMVKSARVIVTILEEPTSQLLRRTASAAIAGQGRTVGGRGDREN